MKLFAKWRRRIEKKYRIVYKRGPSTVAAMFLGVAILAWGLFLLITGFPVAAYAYYTVYPATSKVLSQAIADTGKLAAKTAPVAHAVDVPVSTDINKDVSLPEGHYLTIPSIGVDTVIWEAPYTDYETALKKGVWRVPDFATPADYVASSNHPVILAAHRFGYLDWSQDFRLKNSFYNLPNIKAGDKIRIIWDQHAYVYEVQALTEGTEITDYSADLILYTCKFLISPVRYFVYAKLLN